MLGDAAELTRGRLLARNAVLNVGGWALPAVCALAAIPVLVRAMGAERFGLLAFAWTLVGSFSPLDLGIGRALTQALAARVGREDQRDSPEIVWSAGWLLLGVGGAIAVALAAAAPAIVARWLHVTPALHPDAVRGLRLLALAVPLTALTAGLRGVLEAGQAFRAVNALRVPLALLTFVGPWAMQPLSHSVTASVAVLVAARLLVCAAHAAVVARHYAELRAPRRPRARALGALAGVAGWMTFSALANPILATGDRLLIGAVLPMAAFAQYAAVGEVASKLSVVGAALQPVLLPALAATLAAAPGRASAIVDRGLRAVAVAMAPAALVLVAFAPEGLRLWLGPALARDAAPVLQLLAIAWFVNGCAQLPFVALQAAGRADLPAKFHAAEIPLYLVALWLLVGRFGLIGAAAAFALRIAVDSVALWAAVPRALPDAGAVQRRALGIVAAGVAVLGSCSVAGPLQLRAALAVGALVALAVAAPRALVTSEERAVARAWVGRRVPTRRALRPVAGVAGGDAP